MPIPHAKRSDTLLQGLKGSVEETQTYFEEGHRAREAHQKRLEEMLEETLRNIQKSRGHMQQKARHVKDTTKSFTAKFEHEMSCMREELRHDLAERTDAIEGLLTKLDSRMGELEVDLEKQRQRRMGAAAK